MVQSSGYSFKINTMANKKVILTADDFGAIPFIDKAITAAIKMQNLNCVSAFVCFNDSGKSVKELLQLQLSEAAKGNKFGIGLHFSVTAGEPVTGINNSLTGFYNGQLQFIAPKKYPFKHVTAAINDFKNELKAQIELMGEWLGGIDKIDHVSNHHGVAYVDIDLFEAYIEVISGYNIPIRSPILWSQSHLDYFNAPRLEPPPPWRLNPLTKYGIYKLQWFTEVFESIRFKAKAESAKRKGLILPYCNNDCIYGLPYEKNIVTMIEQYEKAEMVTEFMFHLGYFERDPHDVDIKQINTPNGIDPGYFENRMLEFAMLQELDINKLLSDYAIEKVVFRDLNKNDWEKILIP
ncbi:MAG: hypothetical protein JWP12_89 [Bacteroidetes bacterium]|nr:hypothetical protein [Bacteroidota bacterium]